MENGKWRIVGGRDVEGLGRGEEAAGVVEVGGDEEAAAEGGRDLGGGAAEEVEARRAEGRGAGAAGAGEEGRGERRVGVGLARRAVHERPRDAPVASADGRVGDGQRPFPAHGGDGEAVGRVEVADGDAVGAALEYGAAGRVVFECRMENGEWGISPGRGGGGEDAAGGVVGGRGRAGRASGGVFDAEDLTLLRVVGVFRAGAVGGGARLGEAAAPRGLLGGAVGAAHADGAPAGVALRLAPGDGLVFVGGRADGRLGVEFAPGVVLDHRLADGAQGNLGEGDAAGDDVAPGRRHERSG